MADYLTKVESIQKDPKLEKELVLRTIFSSEPKTDEYNNQKYITLSELAKVISKPDNKLDPSIVFLASSRSLLKIHGEDGKEYRQSVKQALFGELPNLRVHEAQVADAVLKIQKLRETGIKELSEDRAFGRTMIDAYAPKKATT